ncbi:hypothetical protein [Peptoniphilus harei]|uniref:hypothetical protein n=1 Tax=Peptoniphilus harei TaxID=54005 RepID=UPI002114E7ED|nr:hypothetical protein [Peptoniphilus harei]
MDILVSSNLERLIFHKSSDEVVKEKMADLKDKGLFEFKSDFHEFLCGLPRKMRQGKLLRRSLKKKII